MSCGSQGHVQLTRRLHLCTRFAATTTTRVQSDGLLWLRVQVWSNPSSMATREAGSAQRRRERRLSSFLWHERLAGALALSDRDLPSQRTATLPVEDGVGCDGLPPFRHVCHLSCFAVRDVRDCHSPFPVICVAFCADACWLKANQSVYTHEMSFVCVVTKKGAH